ncbi:MAG TPA: acyltransferase [Rhodopila sp.]
MKRLECLDGLRGLLALYVLLGHMAPFAPLPRWMESIVSHGEAAVDVFFILSGLVITQSLHRFQGNTVGFLLARGARIFPVFLAMFALAMLIQPASCGFGHMPWLTPDSVARAICGSDWPNYWPIDVLTHLTMTHGLVPNGILPHVWISFLGSSWSLSTEWQFYILALIVLGACAGRILGARAGRGLGARVGRVPGAEAGGGLGARAGWSSTAATDGNRLACILMLVAVAGVVWNWLVPESWQFSRAFLGNKGHFFALGVASVAVVREQRGAWPIYGVALAMTLLICAAQQSFGKMLPPVVWTLCLAAQLRPDMAGLYPVSWLLRHPGAQYFGAISYCVYLTNEPIHKILATGLSRLADSDAAAFTVVWLPAAFLLPLLASDWLHRHVEIPAQRWGRASALAWPGAHVRITRD